MMIIDDDHKKIFLQRKEFNSQVNLSAQKHWKPL